MASCLITKPTLTLFSTHLKQWGSWKEAAAGRCVTRCDVFFFVFFFPNGSGLLEKVSVKEWKGYPWSPCSKGQCSPVTLGIPWSRGTDRATITPKLVPTRSRLWHTSRLLTETLWFPVRGRNKILFRHLLSDKMTQQTETNFIKLILQGKWQCEHEALQL